MSKTKSFVEQIKLLKEEKSKPKKPTSKPVKKATWDTKPFQK